MLIHFDSTARVDVNGQFYPLTNLEPGDVVDVQLEPNGSTNYLAQRRQAGTIRDGGKNLANHALTQFRRHHAADRLLDVLGIR